MLEFFFHGRHNVWVELGGEPQVMLSTFEPRVPKVGGQVRESGSEIGAALHPAFEAVNGKGVTVIPSLE